MKVTFTKQQNRYDVYVSRDRATDLFIRSAPGYDDWLPHDVLHFVAEAEYGLDGGIFGDVAAGGNARMGTATTDIPAACAALIPFVESSTATHRAASTPSRRAASR